MFSNSLLILKKKKGNVLLRVVDQQQDIQVLFWKNAEKITINFNRETHYSNKEHNMEQIRKQLPTKTIILQVS